MQIQKVGLSQSFSGKRDNINAFINMDDQQLRDLSTSIVMSDDKLIKKTRQRERLNKALSIAFPAAIGLEYAARAEKNKLGTFGKATFGTTLMFAGVSVAFGINRFLKNKSEKYSNFCDNHRVLSALITLPIAALAGIGAEKGGLVAVNKLAKTEFVGKIAKKIGENFNKLKTQKLYTKAGEALKKTPSAIKSVAKYGAILAPYAIIVSLVSNSIKNTVGISNKISNEYLNLKDKQLALAKAMNRELSVQNDFLKTDPQNVEDLEANGMD